MKPIKPDAANLSVTTHGSVSWNDERMGDGQLAQRLQASAPRQPQPEDFIRGDRLVGPPARRPGVGGYAEVRVLKLSFVTDPGSDRGEPKDTPMKLHRHARPDAGVSSSAALIADTSHTRAPARGARRTAARPGMAAAGADHQHSARAVRRPAPRVSATGLLPTGMGASTRCHRRRC